MLARARIVNDYLQHERNTIMIEWPACFPDLNLTEHLCDRAVHTQSSDEIPTGKVGQVQLGCPKTVYVLGTQYAANVPSVSCCNWLTHSLLM